jgi:hypothetical protein
MKQSKLFFVIIALLFAWSGLHAQQLKATRTVSEQAQLDSLKQHYIDLGIPAEWAEKRAQTVLQSRKTAVQTRSSGYGATPVTGSIWLDRDSVTGAPNASHTHNFTPEKFVKDIFVKGGSEIADEAIRNVTLISSTWNGSMTDTWNDNGIMGPFGGDAGTWTNDDRELLYFDHGDTATTIPGWDGSLVPAFGLDKGFLLATGPGLQAEGINVTTGHLGGGFNSWTVLGGGTTPLPNQRDPDLSPIASSAIETFTSLEFDFKPFVDSISFKYIFASEEFPDYANSSVNDIFGFFVSGPGLTDEWGISGDTINIARFPNGAPVTINNSNWGNFGAYNPTSTPIVGAVSPEYHVPVYNNSVLTEYDGHSIVLTARARVQPGQWYHLKLAIGNVGDQIYGSGVFLMAGSLDLGAPESNVPRPYVQTPYDSIYGYSSLYSNCDNQLELTFDKVGGSGGVVRIWSEGSGANYVYDAGEGSLYFKDTVSYRISGTDSALTVKFKVAENVPNGSKVHFLSQIPPSIKKDTSEVFDLYAKSVFTVRKYVPPSLFYAGELDISITNGSPYMQRSLNNGRTWEFARDLRTGAEVPFTASQISRIEDGLYILFREPNTCCTYDSIYVGPPVIVPPVIERRIVIPEIPGVTTYPPAGEYHVHSRDNFVFTVTPSDERYRSWDLKVAISRSVSGDDGVIITPNPDGSYTITIMQVQEDISILVTFTNPVANAAVEQTEIWTGGDQLYIHAAETGDARIYSISGALIQTPKLIAGKTTAIRLPKGFYLVTLYNDKTHKVIIR